MALSFSISYVSSTQIMNTFITYGCHIDHPCLHSVSSSCLFSWS